MSERTKVAIVVGGGPAPGINAVIGAATIRCVLEGVDVIGIQDGFQWLMRGDVDHVIPLDIARVSRIHSRGGSILGIARANPTADPHLLETTILSLLRLDVTHLITIGGDDTAYTAMRLDKQSAGRIHVVHVPKTIDNDIGLPPEIDTFGFQTARHHGAEIIRNLMVDSHTTTRWYFVVSMGRKAGHLALGIGKAAGATLTLIPEEFADRVPFKTITDTLVGAIIKRLAQGRTHGVAIIAEGVVERINPADLEGLDGVERDAHGHLRIAEVAFGEILKHAVQTRLKEFGLKTTIVAKDIGYELRCADPVPFDMEYARDLGYCAAKYLLSGGHAVMVSMQGGEFVPIPFKELLDEETGRTRVRYVNTRSTRYAIARRYMIRLRRDDFDNPHEIARFAAVAGLSLQAFKDQFESLVADEPPPLDIAPPPHAAGV